MHFFFSTGIRKAGDTGQFTPLPFLAGIVNCFFWCLWAFVTPNRLAPIVTNTGGTVLEVIYVVLFTVYCNAEAKRTFYRQLVATVALCAVGIVIALAVDHCPKGEVCDKPFHVGTPQNVAANVLGVVARRDFAQHFSSTKRVVFASTASPVFCAAIRRSLQFQSRIPTA